MPTYIKNINVTTGGRGHQNYTWGRPPNDQFTDIAADTPPLEDNPYQESLFVTWTLGVGADLSTGVNVTPFFPIPKNGVIKRTFAVAKTASTGGNIVFDINHSRSPYTAGSSIFQGGVGLLTINNNQLGGSGINEVTTFRVARVQKNDLLTLDVDTAGLVARDITVILEMLMD